MSNQSLRGPSKPSSLFAHDNRLRAVLRKALYEALVPSLGIGLGVIGACGDAPLDGGTGATGGAGQAPRNICASAAATLGCKPGHLKANFDLLTPAQPVGHWMEGVGLPKEPQLEAVCASEANLAECKDQVYAAIAAVVPQTPPCDGGEECTPGVKYLATRTGNEVQVFTKASQLARLLAPIETAVEADFVARFFSNFEMTCEDKRMGVWCKGDSFSVVSFNRTCSTFDFVLKVTVPHDGSAPSTEEVERQKTGCVIGRLPDDCRLTSESGGGWESASAFFAECAALEAASVPAFMLLADDLRALGAPRELIEAALRSATDEVRHAMMVSALVKSNGTTQTKEVEVPSRAPKTLFDMAHENAVEGCVRETYGVLVGAYQAVAAQDAEVGATTSQLVHDEIAHASLSHAIAAWAAPQLTEAERAQIAASQRAMIAALRDSARQTHANELYAEAGYPQTAAALRMLDVLETSLWNEKAANA